MGAISVCVLMQMLPEGGIRAGEREADVWRYIRPGPEWQSWPWRGGDGATPAHPHRSWWALGHTLFQHLLKQFCILKREAKPSAETEEQGGAEKGAKLRQTAAQQQARGAQGFQAGLPLPGR